ncbi:rod shape-determining protein MreC [Phormidium sp. CLA17]|uniref:rod shape-determining protein MreC n=1 Tax=Leptolyngbya sp. Cla-17 TaxID=2803751 RepID=UPI001491E973|nr:rod shape-determining protein MreC [Leptolyngbya sp. Cla-17]MBM0743858.1 rod shape-determining protein MreC [Leptolyngbya sp. Cla-17]
MFTLRRWWDRHRLQIILTSLSLGSAVFLRQTEGAVLYEAYRLLTFPFQPNLERKAALDNAQVQELEQRLTELESQNQQLRSLVGYISETKKSQITAPVVGRSADHWWQHLILGRGTQGGVQPGSIVMAPGGVVGRVVSATSNTSRVLLLSDPSSRVGATVSRSRNMGYVRGQTSNRAIMEFFDKVPDVRQGDVITTSALSKLFPAGLPIGRVQSVNLNKSPAPEAIIELSTPISFLEWAVVYPYKPFVQFSPTPTGQSGERPGVSVPTHSEQIEPQL